MTVVGVVAGMVVLAVVGGVGFALGRARGAAAGRRVAARVEAGRRADARQAAENEDRLRHELGDARARSHTDAQLLDSLRAASADTMAEQSAQFLDLAEARYRALEQSSEMRWRASGESVVAKLSEYADRLARMEEQHHRESAVLSGAVGDLRRSNEEVRAEARRLSSALTDTRVRGSWGEMQLRRVLEHAGMALTRDFVEQRGDGSGGRPDVVVRLPNDRCVVIDAKAPLDAYLRAMACDAEADRAEHLAQHASAVSAHVTALSRRSYEQTVGGSVDFVVMFVPGDAFLSAAFDVRPDLLESAADADVILASPSTLLAFLRGVACGWRERRVADEAQAIASLGRELHERVAVFVEHFDAVGSALGRAVGSYNQALGSMERRLLVTARRLEEHGAGSRRAIPMIDGVDDLPSAPSAPELIDGTGAA